MLDQKVERNLSTLYTPARARPEDYAMQMQIGALERRVGLLEEGRYSKATMGSKADRLGEQVWRLKPESLPTREPCDAQWERERSCFNELRPALLRDVDLRYKHVAVKDGRVLYSDFDRLALLVRVENEYPDTPVYVGAVTMDEEVVDIPSPELAE